MSEESPTNNGVKYIGAIVVLLGGVYAFSKPTELHIQYLKGDIANLSTKVDEVVSSHHRAEKAISSTVAKQGEKFREVETQFCSSKEFNDSKFKTIYSDMEECRKNRQKTAALLAEFEARLKALEEKRDG